VKVWYLYAPEVTIVPPVTTNGSSYIGDHSVPLCIFTEPSVELKYISPSLAPEGSLEC
jgi:hypothetical protein